MAVPPINARLSEADRATFLKSASDCGLEGGTAARAVLEMVVRRLRSGRTFFEVAAEIEKALGAGGA